MQREALSHLLKDSIIFNASAHGRIVLPEENSGGNPNTLKEVTIDGLPEGSLILKGDKMDPPALFYKDNMDKSDRCECHSASDYRKKCDYIIVTRIDEKNIILYIEMKTSCLGEKYILQLWGGRALMEYLSFILKGVGNICQDSEYIHRFVKFHKINLPKTPTNIHSCPKNDNSKKENDTPQSAYKCDVSNGKPVSFQSLIGIPLQ